VSCRRRDRNLTPKHARTHTHTHTHTHFPRLLDQNSTPANPCLFAHNARQVRKSSPNYGLSLVRLRCTFNVGDISLDVDIAGGGWTDLSAIFKQLNSAGLRFNAGASATSGVRSPADDRCRNKFRIIARWLFPRSRGVERLNARDRQL